MHELSVATGIVDRAVTVADEHGAETIKRLTLEVGVATHVNPDQLRFCIECATEGTPAAAATIEIETITPLGQCDCGWKGEPPTLEDTLTYAPNVRCPHCTERITLVRGRECRLSKVALPDADTQTTENETL